MEPTQLMKLYDGYVGLIQLVPSNWEDMRQPSDSPERRVFARWSIWFTDEKPVRHGHRSCLDFAARKADREVRDLTGESVAA